MAGKGDAEVTIGANADAVERAMAVGKVAARDFANAVTSSIGSAARQVAGDLLNVATATGKISFSSQHQQVKEFEAATAHLSVASGRDLESLRAEYEATGKAIGKRPGEVAAWTSEVGKLTFSFKGAGDAIKGMSALAAETGRNVDEYKGLAVELGTIGHVAGDTTHAVGVLAAQADALGTVGGVAALAGQVEALGDTVSHFSVRSEADFLKVTAAAAALGKGLGDAASKRVQQGAFGAVASDPLRWERYLGHEITDEHGQVKDPAKVLQEITEKTKRRFHKDARRVLMLNFGAETGAAMFNANFNEAAQAAGLAPSTKPQEAQQALNNTDDGKRNIAAAELAASSRALLGSSTLLGSAADKLQQFAAHNPLTSTFIATSLSVGAATFMQSFGQSIATLMGGKGYGGGVRGAIDLATKGEGAPIKSLAVAAQAVSLIGAGAAIQAAINEAINNTELGRGVKFGDITNGYGQVDRGKTADVVKAQANALMQAFQRENAALERSGLSAEDKKKASALATAAIAQNPALGSGSDKDVAALVAALQKQGLEERIVRALTDGFKKIQVNQVPGGPLEVTAASSSSAASGSQAQ